MFEFSIPHVILEPFELSTFTSLILGSKTLGFLILELWTLEWVHQGLVLSSLSCNSRALAFGFLGGSLH